MACAALVAVAFLAVVLVRRPSRDTNSPAIAHPSGSTTLGGRLPGQPPLPVGEGGAGRPITSSATASTGPGLSATVRVGAATQSLQTEATGEWPKVGLAPSGQAQVVVRWPAPPGTPVVAQGEDGARVDGELVKVLTVDAKQEVAFTAAVGAEDGLYQVVLRQGATTAVARFWAGPRPPMNQ
jgi:hypothetical protein